MSAAKLRVATFADYAGIDAVRRRNGMTSFPFAVWRARWETYPFAAQFEGVPIGWVLDTDAGEIVGTIGNVHMLYQLGGRTLRGAIAADWAVDPAWRGSAVQLTTAFFKQKGLDVLINGSASPTASQVLTGLGIPKIPIPDYASPVFWAASTTRFARAALERKEVPGASLFAYPAGLALLARDLVTRSGRGRIVCKLGRTTAFDDRFDVLWAALTAGPERLRAFRTRSTLQWRFGSDLAEGRTRIVTAEQSGQLKGYAVLTHRAGSDLGMEVYDISDLQAEGDDPLIYRDLLIGSVQAAREDRMHAVKLLTGTAAKRMPAMQLRPYSYHLPFWQLFYRVFSPDLKAELAPAGVWDFSLFETY